MGVKGEEDQRGPCESTMVVFIQENAKGVLGVFVGKEDEGVVYVFAENEGK